MADDQDAAEKAAERADARKDKRNERLYSLAVLFIGAALGLGATAITTSMTNSAAASAQQAGFHEERHKEGREAKKTAYLEFLDKADDYAVATAKAKSCIFDAKTKSTAPDGSFKLDGSCGATVVALAPARHAFQAARNAVFVHGSVRAEEQAGLLAGVLPPAVAGDPTTGLPTFDQRLINFEYGEASRFNQLYRGFNAIVRCEIPAEPVEGCPPS